MDAVERIRDAMLRRLAEGPAMFFDLLEAFPDEEYRDILRAWSALRERTTLERTEEGHYLLPRRA
jgi:hypothetical protein